MSPPAVRTEALCKTYRIGGRFWKRGEAKEVEALIDVDLEVPRGEIFGLVGRNGYGKTTLVKCIASLLLPSKGKVQVFGQDTRVQQRSLRRLVGWVGTEERGFYFRLTGEQNLRFFAQLQGMESDVIEERIQLFAQKFAVKELLSRRFHEYSTGNRHKMAIIRGLLHQPRLLMLDEPTRSLDPFAAHTMRQALLEWVKEDPGRTIIITSHNLQEIESLSDRVGVMSRGRLRACGPVEHLRKEWGSGETIGIQLERKPGAWAALCASLTELTWEPSPDRGGWLRVGQRPGDGTLDLVFDELRKENDRILTVERKELSLQDIVDRVDGGPPSLPRDSTVSVREVAS